MYTNVCAHSFVMPDENDSEEEKKVNQTSLSSFFSSPTTTPWVFFTPSSSLEISDRPYNFNRFVDLAHQLSSSSMLASSSFSHKVPGGAPARGGEGGERSPSSLSRKKRLLHSSPSHPSQFASSRKDARLSPERDLKQLMGPSTSFYFRLDNAGYVPSFSSSAEARKKNPPDPPLSFSRDRSEMTWRNDDAPAVRREDAWPSPLLPQQVKTERIEHEAHTTHPSSYQNGGSHPLVSSSTSGSTSAMECKKNWLKTIGSLYQYGSILYEPSSGAHWCWCYTILEQKPLTQYLDSFSGEDEGVCCDFCGWTEWVHARDQGSASNVAGRPRLESSPALGDCATQPSFSISPTPSTMANTETKGTGTMGGGTFSVDVPSSTAHRKRVRPERTGKEANIRATEPQVVEVASSPLLDSIPSRKTSDEDEAEEGKQERNTAEQFFFHCPSCDADFCPRCCEDVKKDERYHIPDMILLPIARGVKREKADRRG